MAETPPVAIQELLRSPKRRKKATAEPLPVHFSTKRPPVPIACTTKEKVVRKVKAHIGKHKALRTNGGRSYQFIINLTSDHTVAQVKKWAKTTGGFVAAYNKVDGSAATRGDVGEGGGTDEDTEKEEEEEEKEEKDASINGRRGRRRRQGSVAHGHDEVRAASAASANPATPAQLASAPSITTHTVIEQVLAGLPVVVRQEHTALSLGDRGVAVAADSVHMSSSSRATDTTTIADIIRQTTQSVSLAIGATAVSGDLNQFNLVFQDCANMYASTQLTTVAERGKAVLDQLQEYMNKGQPPQLTTMVSVALAHLFHDGDPDASRSFLEAARAQVPDAALTAEQAATLNTFTTQLDNAKKMKKMQATQDELLLLVKGIHATVQLIPHQDVPAVPSPSLTSPPESVRLDVKSSGSPLSPCPSRAEEASHHDRSAADLVKASASLFDIDGFPSTSAGQVANRELTLTLAQPRHSTNRTIRAFAGDDAIASSVITRSRSVPESRM